MAAVSESAAVDGPRPRSSLERRNRIARPVAVGIRVIVGGLGLEATVTSVHDGTADLDVRGKRMRASVRDLRVIGGQAPAGARQRQRRAAAARDDAVAI